jgi:hypothetical protein
MSAKTGPQVWAGGERELKGHAPRSQPSEPSGAWVVMAVPFLAVATFIALFMSGVIGDGSRPDDMPMSVPLMFGFVFSAAGIFLVVAGIRGERRQRRLREARSLHPDEPWLWEHPWQARVHDGARQRALREFVFPVIWLAFLAPFHEVFGWGGMLILMDVAGLAMLGHAVYLLVRYLRFGHTELELGRVPFRLGETFEASLLPAPSLVHLERVTVTLRCIQERTETRGHGKNRKLEVIGYERYCVTEQLDAGALRQGQPLRIVFPLPNDPTRLGTCLGERPPRYWELTLDSEVSGVDYHATFLVPIYSAASLRRSMRKKKSSRAA